MLLKRDEFLAKYGILTADFERTKLDWDELTFVHEDHLERAPDLRQVAQYIHGVLATMPLAHTVRFRVKDPEHLVEKIIRKRIGGATCPFTLETYRQDVTDLVGLRVLHLLKGDWTNIHPLLERQWEPHEAPFAYVRNGDLEDQFRSRGLDVRVHPSGYRSVHYTIKVRVKREELLAEIQVRTLIEEAWSEIDHSTRYPNNLGERLLSDYLLMFNRLAGSADEMGSYIHALTDFIGRARTEERKKLDEKNKEIDVLQKQIAKLRALEATERDKIAGSLERLRPALSGLSFAVPEGTPGTVGGGSLLGLIDLQMNHFLSGSSLASSVTHLTDNVKGIDFTSGLPPHLLVPPQPGYPKRRKKRPARKGRKKRPRAQRAKPKDPSSGRSGPLGGAQR